MNLQLFSQERTERATPRRREEARKRGQVLKSMELVGALSLLATYMALRFVGPFMAGRIVNFARTLWEEGPLQDWSEAGVRNLFVNTTLLVALVSAPLLLVAAVVGTIGNVLQIGFLFTLDAIVPKFDRLNPVSGLQRLFSRRAVVEMAKSLGKLLIIGFVAYRTVADDFESFPGLLGLEAPQVVQFLSDLVSRLLLWVGICMLVIALGDYFYQRWEFETSLMMSKQEIKEEMKQSEGDPLIKSKIKRRQREMARRRMMQDVQKADVVVTNPTHFAVAIRYDQQEMKAPRVVAKGQGLIALRIRELATGYGVPVVENPPLARSLHRGAEIGDEIPLELYQAVAEMLAYVYRFKQKGF